MGELSFNQTLDAIYRLWGTMEIIKNHKNNLKHWITIAYKML
jgi:hypothetical protein